jgi:hypothetical protein
MHLKVFLKLKKNPKTLSSGQKNPKNPKKPKKPKKNQKTHWVGFKKKKKKTGFFPTLPSQALRQLQEF